MTYIAENPANTVAVGEKQLVTIEFTSQVHSNETDYSYPHPRFTFFDRVTPTDSYPATEYTVCALEIIESKTPSGRLLSQPRWNYKISNGQTSFWKEETALLLYSNCSTGTCSFCDRFQDFHEHNGRGWCQQFNRYTKAHHQTTNDCVLSGALKESSEAFPAEEIVDEADLTHSPYQIGSLVKIIDPIEHHSEWAVFEVVQTKHNDHHFNSTETYLNSHEWLYRLVNTKYEDTYSKSLWVRENEICHFDESHLICTEEIF